MLRSRAIACVAVVAISGGLAGCGSTALRSGGVANGGTTTGDGLSVPPGGDGGATSGTSLPGSGGSGSTSGTTGTGGSLSSGTTGTGAFSSTSGGATGGTTGGATGGSTGAKASSKPITVGVTYPDVSAIAAAFGQDASEADPKTWINRIITYVNKNGGISGRSIRPVWYKADTAADNSQSGQQACATFTQDNKVDFVVNTGFGGDTLPTCLRQRGVSMIGGPYQFTDTVDMRRVPNVFSPNGMRLDRLFSSIVRLSAGRGLLPKGAKLGVLVEDCPWGSRIYDNTLAPLAKQLGVKVEKGTVHCITNLVSDLGPVTSDIQRETLRFAADGVTHVISVSGAEAFIVAQFTKNASQQKYFPKYLLSSTAYPFNDSRPGGAVSYSRDAVANMTGYGFNPLLDVGRLARPDTPGQKEVQARCLAADPKEGIYAKDKGKDGYYFSVGVIRGYCDAFFVLKAMLENDGVKFDLSDLTRSYRSLLDGRLSSTLNAGGFFRVPKDGLDAIGLLKPFTWDAKQDQFVYNGASVAVP